jgi:hypothetical protein
MTKIQELKEAMKNPPPERLARIEYRSHLFQALGVTFVCIVLIQKGFWYIIFAFIFSLGISYSQGMTAYKRYEAILAMKDPEKMEDYEKDISPTRKRNKIIESVLPHSKWLSSIFAVVASVAFIDATLSRWLLMLLYPLSIIFIYVLFHFFLLYYICYPIYRDRIELKGGKENVWKKETRKTKERKGT